MEGDDDELETFLRLLEDVQSVHVVSSYFAHVLTCHGVYFTQRLQLCGICSRAASIRGNTPTSVVNVV